jgi:subtilisin family serine protease
MSTALMAGVVALIRAKYPTLSPEGIMNRLKATAIDKGPTGFDEEYGYGVVDPVAALTKDVADPGASASTPAVSGSSRSTEAAAGGSSNTTMRVLGTLVCVGAIVVAIVALVLALVVVSRRRKRR